MNEVTITPAHGLKQGEGYPLRLTYTGLGILPSDTARMELRFTLDDPGPVDVLTTENGRIRLEPAGDNATTLVLALSGEASRAYPITSPDRSSRYRKLKPEEAPLLTKRYMVLALYGTLLLTGADGQDRTGTALDLALLFEATYTRGGL